MPFHNPVIIRISPDGQIFNLNSTGGYFQISELLEIQEALKTTIDIYIKNGYSDEVINQFEESCALEYRNKISSIPLKKTRSHLYLIHDSKSNALKIGVSTNVKKRLSQLNTANPNPLTLLCVLENMGHNELFFHSKFSAYNITREWFAYNEEIVSYFKNFKV